MAEATSKDLFLASLERCSANAEFIPAFYKRFLASSEEISIKFRFTNFEKQNAMLLNSLRMSAGATSGSPEALQELKARALSHDRDHLDIKPELYHFWLDAAIATVEEFDDNWTEEVAAAWEKILGFVVEYFKRRY
ncbi:globin [Bythopirellula goksoeyrii]|uniref:Globin family profile domain-containing protein n=1 Tax=Bythopirellula goksoeyrii TaxID=1400387 RepID=A0A5B9QHI6_9BACT|nr:globin [Bythopirellula goksoeyrii]QEG33681.1 hypothetical protein Pr1d_09450 [Bythopirellula goksoeyrii]